MNDTSKKTNLLKSTLTIGIWGGLSRALGFARDMLFARYFGTSNTMDAFIVAFRIPNFIRRIFNDGVISQTFIPVLKKQQHNKKHFKIIIRQFITSIALLGLIFSFCGIFFSSLLVIISAPGFYDDTRNFILTNDLIKIMFPYVFLYCLLHFLMLF